MALPKLNARDRARLQRVANEVAPGVPLDILLRDSGAYERPHRHRASDLGTRPLSPEERAARGDNRSAFPPREFKYAGAREQIDALVQAGDPVFVLHWHHGARFHADLALLDAFPGLALFTRRVFQYGTSFSYPMDEAGPLSLVRMDRFLRDGRPIAHYVDGEPLGKTVQVSMLGLDVEIAVAPIELVQAIPAAHLVVASNSYRGRRTVETRLALDPLGDDWRDRDPREVVQGVLDYLQRDLVEQDIPGAIRFPFLLWRERAMTDRARRGSEKIT